jgi:hypothetical protein
MNTQASTRDADFLRDIAGPELVERLEFLDASIPTGAAGFLSLPVPPAAPVRGDHCDFDVVIAGGGLSLLLAPVLAAWAGCSAEAAACESQIGSGALPLETLPSFAVCLRGAGLDALAARLRALPRPVIGRIHEGALWLDLRCLEDEAGFVANLTHPAAGPHGPEA